MSLYVFISATSEDLKDDCRPAARKAVEFCDGVAVAMEDWDTDYEPTLDVIKKKIKEECGHYIGIFAHRYGWTPKGETKSITELEFDWSVEFKKKMAVFLPERACEFDFILRKRAKEQSKKEKDEQDRFLKKVAERGTYMPFLDADHLEHLIIRKVARWSVNIREIAKKDELEPIPKTKKKDIINLGIKEQIRQFEESLAEIITQDAAAMGCFMIHGKTGYGHSELLQRIMMCFEGYCDEEPRKVSFCIDALWRESSVENLVSLIGDQLEIDWKKKSIKNLAAGMRKILTNFDIVLIIDGIQRLHDEDPIACFHEEFLEPLYKALDQDFPNQLLIIASLEGENSVDNQTGICALEDIENYVSHQILPLDELAKITEKELVLYLRKRYSIDKAKTLAEVLIKESDGNPSILFKKLQNKF